MPNTNIIEVPGYVYEKVQKSDIKINIPQEPII